MQIWGHRTRTILFIRRKERDDYMFSKRGVRGKRKGIRPEWHVIKPTLDWIFGAVTKFNKDVAGRGQEVRESLMCRAKGLILVRLGSEKKVETDPDPCQNETAACDDEVEGAEECFEGERFRKIEEAWRVQTCN